MKEQYEKIFLGSAAGIFLLGLLGYFLLAGSLPARVGPLSPDVLQGEDYQPMAPAVIADVQIEWPAPPYQDPANKSWLYHVFTPPKIHFNPETGVLAPDDGARAKRLPFGIELIGIERPNYRFIFKGYAGSESQPLLTLHDVERNVAVGPSGISQKGKHYPEHDVRIVDFRVEVKVEGSTVNRDVRIVLYDERLKREMELKQGEIIVMDELQVVKIQPVVEEAQGDQRVTRPKGAPRELRRIGETFQMDEQVGPLTATATFTLLKIDFDNQSVQIKKESSLLEKGVEEVWLHPSKKADPASPPPSRTPTQTPPPPPPTRSPGAFPFP